MYPDPKIAKSEGAEVIHESEAGQIIRGWDRAIQDGGVTTVVLMAVTPDGHFTILDVQQHTEVLPRRGVRVTSELVRQLDEEAQ